MGKRNKGFLQEHERLYIENRAGSIDADIGVLQKEDGEAEWISDATRQSDQRTEVSHPAQRKYDIQNDIASPSGFRDAIQTFTNDIRWVKAFHGQIREQPGGTYDWQDRVLRASKDELKALHELIGGLLKIAEDPPGEFVIEKIADRLTPLYEGVAENEMEVQERRRALTSVLWKQKYRILLNWIADNTDKKLTESKVDVKEAKWHASRKLRTDLGLIDDPVHDHVYELTERGEAVHTAWQSLGEAPIVTDMVDDGQDVGLVALHLLSHHFDAEEFPDAFDVDEESSS